MYEKVLSVNGLQAKKTYAKPNIVTGLFDVKPSPTSSGKYNLVFERQREGHWLNITLTFPNMESAARAADFCELIFLGRYMFLLWKNSSDSLEGTGFHSQSVTLLQRLGTISDMQVHYCFCPLTITEQKSSQGHNQEVVLSLVCLTS